MASSLNASTSGGGGVIVTSDATGNLDIQSGGSTVFAVTSAGVAVTGSLNTPNTFGFKNRIINGGMVIDQRNAGAAIAGGYAVDRFEFQENSSSVFTIQKSTTAPAGFINSMLVTVTTAASATAAQVNRFFQRIEGNNIADFGFGAAGAATVTLSFWVRSSLTGTYCVALVNNAANRSYVAEYTISSANTWEQKTITIAGDTSGTWETGTSIGVQVTFDLGGGSNYNTTAGAWAAGNYTRTTNQANFANTLNATFYITGVQLEKGSTATSFDYRDYGRELIMCQRYYEQSITGSVFTGRPDAVSFQNANTAGGISNEFKASKRSAPTMTLYAVTSGTVGNLRNVSTGADVICGTANIGVNRFLANANATTAASTLEFHWIANAEL